MRGGARGVEGTLEAAQRAQLRLEVEVDDDAQTDARALSLGGANWRPTAASTRLRSRRLASSHDDNASTQSCNQNSRDRVSSSVQ